MNPATATLDESGQVTVQMVRQDGSLAFRMVMTKAEAGHLAEALLFAIKPQEAKADQMPSGCTTFVAVHDTLRGRCRLYGQTQWNKGGQSYEMRMNTDGDYSYWIGGSQVKHSDWAKCVQQALDKARLEAQRKTSTMEDRAVREKRVVHGAFVVEYAFKWYHKRIQGDGSMVTLSQDEFINEMAEWLP